MAPKKVYSVCGMCTVRCLIQADVENDECLFLQGNPKNLKGALCARGGAGYALSQDTERPQYPLIREGERGEGKWRRVSWDEALDYVADKLKALKAEHGPETLLWSDRGGPFPDLHQAFVKGFGSPNYCNHDVSCARNVQHAAKSVTGMGRKEFSYDLKNAKHIVLQTRNIFEAINVSEVNNTLDALESGCKLTVIDVRGTITASKADNFFMIRPGADYAFNLAVINVLLERGLYDKEFAATQINGLDQLKAFVRPYTPEWAEAETGIPASRIVHFVKELAEAAPSVIWHPGWMAARYKDSFWVCRTAYIINALLGSIGSKGGLPLTMKAADAGRKGLKSLAGQFEKPAAKRADGAGWKYKHIDPGPGMIDKAYNAIESSDPYPVRAYLCFRHDPLMALPDPEAIKKKWEKLDLLVSVTFSWSETAWHSDVVLPLSPYLERESIIAHKGGLKPMFFVRKRAISPRYETKAEWEILCGLAKRLGIDKLAFDSIEDIWNYQLQDTGVKIEDFDECGFVELSAKPIYKPRSEIKFKTPSGKIEIINPVWEEMGFSSLKPYESPERPPEGRFRIVFARVGVHTQGHTVNNPLLNEQMPENTVWLNTKVAKTLGIADGDLVEVSNNGYSAKIKATVTDLIHPEAAFMVHGFGHKLRPESRAGERGAADQRLMPGGLDKDCLAGGSLALQEHFISVKKA
ncbi:molybdopterin-dependent oxidoreductase [Desulfocurvibacter africanus]|uniref:Nitrate reductase n=1 Tax=Desulfocurvibacter africanus subsp. africanus str. Walvis Bay TaxID=690850 RepID=F3Z166_DESAF|nr:molybdopterin-dependent oxidoreductase [Desulfocurvibacter africanus]EGJ49964.1 Nitrate reductase [Desulfocurvibacter africanus subsp. africanus str. Walvis Bay]